MIYRRIQWILSRTIIAYGVAAVLLFVLADYKKACVRRLNTIVRWSDYPVLLDKRSVALSEEGLRKAMHYYQVLAEGFPQLDQSYGMLGYCYWLSGDNSRAIHYYQEAKKRRPDGFWYDYNLGVLHNGPEHKEEALVFFKNIVEYDTRGFTEGILPASLPKLSQQERQPYYKAALDFTGQIRDLSWRNIMKTSFDRQKYEEVITIALIAKEDPLFTDKTSIWLYAGAAAYMAGQFKIAMSFFATVLRQQPDYILANNFFILAKNRLEGTEILNDQDVFKNFFEDPILFPSAMGKVMLHPWSYDILPGQESFL